jgi:hypothetical protein
LVNKIASVLRLRNNFVPKFFEYLPHESKKRRFTISDRDAQGAGHFQLFSQPWLGRVRRNFRTRQAMEWCESPCRMETIRLSRSRPCGQGRSNSLGPVIAVVAKVTDQLASSGNAGEWSLLRPMTLWQKFTYDGRGRTTILHSVEE